jgi:hypothetical protein
LPGGSEFPFQERVALQGGRRVIRMVAPRSTWSMNSGSFALASETAASRMAPLWSKNLVRP